jgi:1-acyl-sn-glycerol-3-phosphate acyltransferase
MTPSLDLMAHLAVETLRISVPTIIDAALGTVSSQLCDERLDSWSRELVKAAGIHLAVNGREHLVHGEGYIVMSNHQSHYDIPVLFQALQIPMRMVAKKEIFRIPFMSGAMRAAGFVELDRQNERRAIGTLITAHERLHGSMSIWIAPEGTRSRTGRLGPFKRGGFRMALHSGMRILPVTIDGTQRTLPAGRLAVSRGNVARVTISAPVDPANYGPTHMNDLISTVREAIDRHVPRPSGVTTPAQAFPGGKQ